jgi:hypothetical protein
VQYARPLTTSDCETTVDHRILHAVICRIVGIVADTGKSTDTSVLHRNEHEVSNEQAVAGSDTANVRADSANVDIMAHQPAEYMSVVLPMMIQKPIEIKTARDDASKFKKAIEKGRSQIVGHLWKRVMCAFDFGGTGHNTCTVGVSLTLLSIEVVKVSLTNIGTLNVNSAASTTGCMPFLERRMMSKGQNAALGPQLNGNGFVVLAGALMYKSPTECLADITQVTPMKEVLHGPSYLGSGAFSNVYKLEQVGCFLKLPKSASFAINLEQEANILKSLQRGQPCALIPKCASSEGVSQFQSKIRGEISFMKGLRLSGVVGLPLHRLPRSHWDTHAKSIVKDMFAALKFAHSKSIFHLDVQPGNIIVGFAESGECNAMLSDWGCAIEKVGRRQKMQSFRGCTPYAHDRLLGKTPIYSIGNELDFASLAYTLNHVSAGELRWIAAFAHPSQVSDEDKTLRWNSVSAWLKSNDLVLPGTTVDRLKAACR